MIDRRRIQAHIRDILPGFSESLHGHFRVFYSAKAVIDAKDTNVFMITGSILKSVQLILTEIIGNNFHLCVLVH